MTVAGKIVVVTGARQGQGAAEARLLAARGALDGGMTAHGGVKSISDAVRAATS